MVEFILVAETGFCHDFSATSESSSNDAEMQAESGAMRQMQGAIVEELQGYLALHVSFAHITPGKTLLNRASILPRNGLQLENKTFPRVCVIFRAKSSSIKSLGNLDLL